MTPVVGAAAAPAASAAPVAAPAAAPVAGQRGASKRPAKNGREKENVHQRSSKLLRTTSRPREQVARAFAETQVIGFDEAISHGYFDPGRARVDSMGWRSLSYWEQAPFDAAEDREVLCKCDSIEGGPLVIAHFTNARTVASGLISEREKYKSVMKLCSQALGGVGTDAHEAAVDCISLKISQRAGTNVIPLEMFMQEQLGNCRHQATLFKATIDYLREDPAHYLMRCKLVRGSVGDQPHMWCRIRLASGEEIICDVYQEPDALIALSSDDAQRYSSPAGNEASATLAARETLNIPINFTILEGEITYAPDKEVRGKGLLGTGSFSSVYRAEWRSNDVAVKKLSIGTNQHDVQDMAKREFKQLAQVLKSPHIVNIYGGACDPTLGFFLVMELMELGSLEQCLERQRRQFSWFKQGKSVLFGPLKGLVYLHGFLPEPIIHYDIKPANIGVTLDGAGKLMDVGCARELKATKTNPTHYTECYAAPEVLRMMGSTTKSDVFSFGLIIYEVYCEKQPNMNDVLRHGLSHLGIKDNWAVKPLLHTALQAMPEERCSARQLKEYYMSHMTLDQAAGSSGAP